MTHRPLVILEIDKTVCSLTYGQGACTASLSATRPNKCYNCIQHCQDPDNFSPATQTLRFGLNAAEMPSQTEVQYFPSLIEADRGGSAEISPGVVSDTIGTLGMRERIKITLQDHPDNGSLTDPYWTERISGAAQFSGVGFDPEQKSTFWAKELVRWPYWPKAPVRIREGEIGQAFADWSTRHYVLDKIQGPGNDGRLTLDAIDPISLIGEDKLIPQPSNGLLAADIESETDLVTFTVEPEGVGAEYAESGRICIGTEVMLFTRVDDEFTIVSRSVDGTEASTHSRGDTVQECARFENIRPSEAAEAVALAAEIDPAFIPSADWEAEATRWMGATRLTRTIPKPEKAITAMSSLLVLGFALIWDRENQVIRFRAAKPVEPGESVPSLSTEIDFINGTFSKTTKPKEQYTSVLFAHGVKDPTQSLDNLENYKSATAIFDTDTVGPNKLETGRTLIVFCPWFEVGNDAVTRELSTRILYRFRDVPVVIEGALDYSEKDGLILGNAVDLTASTLPDENGDTKVSRFQLMKVKPERGSRVYVKLQSDQADRRFGFIAEDGRGDYSSASETDIKFGTYICPDSLEFPDGTGPYVFF